MRDNNVYRQKPHKYFILISLKIQERERERAHFTTFICCTHPSTAENTRRTRLLHRQEKERKPHLKLFLFVLCTSQEEQRWVFEPSHDKRERNKKRNRDIGEKQEVAAQVEEEEDEGGE